VKSIRQLMSFAAICVLVITPATLVARDQVLTVPAGTAVNVRMIDSISSDRNHAGEIFRGTLDSPISIGNRTVFPRGATAYVKLVDARSAGRIKGRSELKLQLDRIVVGNHTYPVSSQIVGYRGKSETKQSLKSTGIGAAVGGGLGAIFGGGKGAAIGAGLGGGAGLGSNAMHEGDQIYISPESLVQFHLSSPMRIGR
jgi:hypothetical protein